MELTALRLVRSLLGAWCVLMLLGVLVRCCASPAPSAVLLEERPELERARRHRARTVVTESFRR